MQLKDTGGDDFEITPTGVYTALCYQVIDLGIKHNAAYGNDQRKLRIAWELSGALMEDGRPFSISSTYTASLSTKANLRRDLEAWRGRAFTDEQLMGFSPKELLGVPCQVNVIHNESNGKTYANIGSIMPLGKDTPKPMPVNTPLYFSWDETREQYANLPDWVREKAMGTDPEQHQSQPSTNEINQEMAMAGSDGFEDSDIPF